MKSKDLSTYSMGGLYTYFAAMDDATSFDPNTFSLLLITAKTIPADI